MKKAGKFVLLAAGSALAAAGIGYAVKQERIKNEAAEDAHTFEGDFHNFSKRAVEKGTSFVGKAEHAIKGAADTAADKAIGAMEYVSDKIDSMRH